MSRNNASFSANAAAFHNAHVQKLKTLDAEPVLTLTADGNVTQPGDDNLDDVTVHATKGKITMAIALAANTSKIFVFYNRFITTDSKIFLTVHSLASSGDGLPVTCQIMEQNNGSCTISIYNQESAAATNTPPVIHYLILD